MEKIPKTHLTSPASCAELGGGQWIGSQQWTKVVAMEVAGSYDSPVSVERVGGGSIAGAIL